MCMGTPRLGALCSAPVRSPRTIELDDDGRLLLFEGFVPWEEAGVLGARLMADLAWRQESIRIAGRLVAQPRLSAWYGDPEAHYRYSGLSLSPSPFTSDLEELRGRVEGAAGARFNAVLCNLYRDGCDSVGWHADAEPELGRDPVVGSLSFGATRRFMLRHVRRATRHEFALAAGTLLVMAGSTQHHYRHSVPKERAVGAPRVNLTFRRVLAADAQRPSVGVVGGVGLA